MDKSKLRYTVGDPDYAGELMCQYLNQAKESEETKETQAICALIELVDAWGQRLESLLKKEKDPCLPYVVVD